MPEGIGQTCAVSSMCEYRNFCTGISSLCQVLWSDESAEAALQQVPPWTHTCHLGAPHLSEK